MAGGIPPSDPPPRGRSRWPRGWLEFEQYRVIHDRYMDVLVRDGYVESDSLRFTLIETAEGRIDQVSLVGIIHCSDGVAVEVTKFMDVRPTVDSIAVLTTYYRYHAWRPGRAGELIVRYDQAHGVPHCHRFGPDGEAGDPVPITLDDMPRLDEVVRQAVDTARQWDLGAWPRS